MGSKKKKVVVGTKYYIGFHIVLCHTSDNITLTKIYAGEREAWSGSVSTNSQIYINKENLFGGDRKEGGIKGRVDVMIGAPDQEKNTYMVSKISENVPAFRGVLSLVARQIYCTAGSPYIKPWWALITSIVQESWYPSKANINSGSANAAHIIRECIVNEEWGMGVDESYIDNTSFTIFADALYDEGLGLSMLLIVQDKIDKFIQEVLRHVQGVIYTERTTGKYVIKLIRGDYTIGDTPIFDENNIDKVLSYDKPSPAEILDEVVIKYRPRGKPSDAASAFQNLATVESQSGIVSKTVEYPGIDTHANAARMAAREIRQQSASLSKVRLQVNREAWNLNIGDVFRFSYEEYGIEEIVMRINSMNYGELTTPHIIMDAVQDVFSLTDASYLDPPDTGWSDPIVDPSTLDYQRVDEAMWWDIVNTFDPANTDLIESNVTASYFIFSGIEKVPSPGFELWSRVGTIDNPAYDDYAGYVPDALLTEDLDFTTTTDIEIYDMDEVGIEEDTKLGQYAIIDDEYVRIDAIDVDTGLMTIGRGCLDTIPAEHTAGTRIWFAEENAARSVVEYTSGVAVRAQAKVETGNGLLDLDSSQEVVTVMAARQNKPYPPGQFYLNTVNFPTAITGELLITWAHRDRLAQTVELIDHLDSSTGPETDVEYELNIYDEDDVLVKTETGLTGTSYTWTTEIADSGQLNSSIRIELKSVRDTVDSWQEYNYTVDRAGYGLNYGKYYGGI